MIIRGEIWIFERCDSWRQGLIIWGGVWLFEGCDYSRQGLIIWGGVWLFEAGYDYTRRAQLFETGCDYSRRGMIIRDGYDYSRRRVIYRAGVRLFEAGYNYSRRGMIIRGELWVFEYLMCLSILGLAKIKLNNSIVQWIWSFSNIFALLCVYYFSNSKMKRLI